MRIVYNFFVAIMVLSAFSLVTGCSSEQSTNNCLSKRLSPQLTKEEFSFLEKYIKKSKTISPDDAVAKVCSQDLITSKTRSGDIAVTRVDVLRKENYNLFGDSIFNLLPDTLAYLISTDDGLCTAIPADYRACTPVLGIFPQSQIYDLNTDTDWEIRDMLCEMFAGTTVSEICAYEASHDSLEKVVLEKLNLQRSATSTRALDDPEFNPDDYNFFEVYGPVIDDGSSYKNPMVPYSWNQFEPYNQNVCYYNCSSGTAPVGCAALATAMLMTYWQHPASVNGTTVNWTAIRSQNGYSSSESSLPGAVQLAWLLEKIGLGLNMVYSCSVSTAQFILITGWLSNNGYTCSAPINYGYNQVKTSLDHGRPVIISGYSSSSSIGHAWVIHGYNETHKHQTKTIYAIHKVTGQQFVYYEGTVYYNNYILYNNMGNGSGTTQISSSSYNTLTFPTYNNNKTIYTEIRPQ